MTREEFILFVEDLRKDFLTNKQNWENDKVDLFLESIAAYVEDIDGLYNNNGQKVDTTKVDWKIFADILKGASLYE